MSFDDILENLRNVEWKMANAQDLHAKLLFNQVGALRAVVEMHKPFALPLNKNAVCAVCINYDELLKSGAFPMPFESYPCPTIQTIAEALEI